MAMLCRVAEDVFWMSRYVERAAAVGRLLEVTGHLELDEGDAISRRELWQRLVEPRAGDGALPEELTPASGGLEPLAVRNWLALDRRNPRSLVSCVQRGRSAARRVRESISSEMWEAINALYLWLAAGGADAAMEEDSHPFYRRVMIETQYIQGLADATLSHDDPWYFTCLGKYLERADNVAHMLTLQAHLLHERNDDDQVRWLAVLRSCGAAEAYARYYSLRVDPARVVEFMLLNSSFPQTVRFSLRHAWHALQQLSGSQRVEAGREGVTIATRSLGLLSAQLEHAAVDEILESGLQSYLAALQKNIARVCDQVTRVYLRDEPQPGRVVAVARAAMLMAEQQQQQQEQQ